MFSLPFLPFFSYLSCCLFPETKGGRYNKAIPCSGEVWTPAFITHFPLFAPAWSRRPYYSEVLGALLLDLDMQTLAGKSITVEASLPSNATTAGAAGATPFFHAGPMVVTQQHVKLPFDLVAALPTSIDADATITVTVHGDGGHRHAGVIVHGDRGHRHAGSASYTGQHIRRIQRSPPLPTPTTVTSWQVDHETRGMLRDGVPFIMSGWFAGGKREALLQYDACECVRVCAGAGVVGAGAGVCRCGCVVCSS